MEDLVKGIFISEKKNRFLCEVQVEGINIECYISSSCKLSNFIDTFGKEVLLMPVKKKKARTQYFLYAIKLHKQFVMVDLKRVNGIVEEQLPKRFFSFLGKRNNISREKLIGRYKADLFIEDTNTIIEVKSVLSVDKISTFPGVNSDRAVMQLRELKRLLSSGYKVCYIFISLNPETKKILINNAYQEYYQRFQECIEEGMIVRGYCIQVNGLTQLIKKRIEISTV